MNDTRKRLESLEGLRGLAAFVVVIFHALLIFYPAFFYGPELFVNVHNVHFEDNLFGTPMNVFLSGPFAVAVFFIISGFVLTIGYFKSHDSGAIKRLAAKRYLRLMLPALASVLLVCMILYIGLGALKDDTVMITQSSWLASIWPINPNIGDAFIQGVWGIFAASSYSYNPVLWTIGYELIGSLFVFLICILFGDKKNRWVIYVLAIILTYSSWYLGFILGMILADLYSKNMLEMKKQKTLIVGSLLAIALFLGSFPAASVQVQNTIYNFMVIEWLTLNQNQALYLTIGAFIIVGITLVSRRISKILSRNIFQLLGKYSYSMYLIHMPIIFTVTAGFFLLLVPFQGYNISALVSIIATLPILAVGIYLFEKYVDRPSIKLSGVFADWLLRDDVESAKLNKRNKKISNLLTIPMIKRRLSSFKLTK